VFQGRFRSALVDGEGAWLLDVSAYVHLNPVRVSSLGLSKAENKAEALGLVEPDREKVQERLKVLREHRWSSYRGYGNYGKCPDWLITDEILSRAGGRAAYRKLVQQYVTRGMDPGQFETLSERVAIGSTEFLDRVKRMVSVTSPEQPARSFFASRVAFDDIVEAVERTKGEAWSQFNGRYGDWGTAMVLCLARQHSGLTLNEIGECAGGMEYKAVSAQVSRFKKRLAGDAWLRGKVAQCQQVFLNVVT
jgi:hypothetical protein